jgi:predicted nucleic acid-binding protein
VKRFLDTNILLYSISTDPSEAEKRRRAIDALGAGGITLSVQVLQEFYVQATRPSRSDRLPHEVAAGLVQTWCRHEVVDVTQRELHAAMELAHRHRLSYWDAAIVAAAAAARCEMLLTEDLAHDTRISGVHIVDPFR